MKIVKFDEEYYLLEEAAISSGEYLFNNGAVIKIIRATEVRKGLLVVATTDSLIDELPRLDVSIIDRPVPEVFQPTDMIAYSNWVLNWCSNNKYRKILGGVKPFGTGEEYNDDQLFNMYIESLKQTKIEWDNVEVEINEQENIAIIKNL